MSRVSSATEDMSLLSVNTQMSELKQIADLVSITDYDINFAV